MWNLAITGIVYCWNLDNKDSWQWTSQVDQCNTSRPFRMYEQPPHFGKTCFVKPLMLVKSEHLVLWILWITVACSFALMQLLIWKTGQLSSNIKVGQNICFICKTPHFEIARQFKIQGGPGIVRLKVFLQDQFRENKLESLRDRGFIHNQEVISEESGSLEVKQCGKNVRPQPMNIAFGARLCSYFQGSGYTWNDVQWSQWIKKAKAGTPVDGQYQCWSSHLNAQSIVVRKRC